MAAAETRNGRGLRWALIGSAVLNLLLLGFFIGGWIAHERHPPRPVVGDVSLGAFTGALSPEDRDALRKAAQARGSEFRDMRRQARSDMTALIAAIDAEPWDRAQVAELLERHKARTVQRVDIGEQLILDRLDAMSAESRHSFAERLREGAARFDKRKKDREDTPKPKP
ncbi:MULTISPECIES: periplasmic heavy metal sensor [unclassified Thioclava]|uniref:periplasmic heavy metal sensor n=1 Tax=unclassified Thioclava TaxID=2621713 RepID=UPI00099747AB|nr:MULTISPECIES: periplasmic heavy metal sensor [unclassified Thioclava]OOY03908.1 hypothetical protein BMI87_16010 [Thioclava sp. F28-4]OOY09922.1 hypothetical protein BMI89_03700 [Thioclava sp. F36-7]